MIRVTCAIIIEEGKIFIAQNGNDSDHPFKWEFPGGKIAHGEDAEQCIIREIKEELGIDIKCRAKLKSVTHHYGFREIELIPFICEQLNGQINLHEHNDYRWVEFEQFSNIDLLEADIKLIGEKSNSEFLEKYIREQMYKS